MIITGVKPVGKGRYEIFLDEGSYPAFALYRNDMKKFDIREGSELSHDTMARICSETLVKRAVLRLYHLIESRDYTEAELRERLRRGAYPSSVIESAIEQLKEQGLVDDTDYALRYAECYIDRKSRKAVVQALARKGVAGNVAAKAVEQVCEERVISVSAAGDNGSAGDSSLISAYHEGEYDECYKIRRLLEKRHFDPAAADNREYNKQVTYLMGKGYAYRDISRAICDMEIL